MEHHKQKKIKAVKAWAGISYLTSDSGEIDGLNGLPLNSGDLASIYMIYETKRDAKKAKEYYPHIEIIPVLITPLPKNKKK